ncbi:hypothetical protein D3C85_1189120 [compost metagenome]
MPFQNQGTRLYNPLGLCSIHITVPEPNQLQFLCGHLQHADLRLGAMTLPPWIEVKYHSSALIGCLQIRPAEQCLHLLQQIVDILVLDGGTHTLDGRNDGSNLIQCKELTMNRIMLHNLEPTRCPLVGHNRNSRLA